jgi:hypothetical protein
MARALILEKGYRDEDIAEIAREAAIANGHVQMSGPDTGGRASDILQHNNHLGDAQRKPGTRPGFTSFGRSRGQAARTVPLLARRYPA